jgi:hypothetical protein
MPTLTRVVFLVVLFALSKFARANAVDLGVHPAQDGGTRLNFCPLRDPSPGR